MALGRRSNRDRGRFSKSGHTSHARDINPSAPLASRPAEPSSAPPRYSEPRYDERPQPERERPYPPEQYREPEPSYRPEQYRESDPRYREPEPRYREPDPRYRPDQYREPEPQYREPEPRYRPDQYRESERPYREPERDYREPEPHDQYRPDQYREPGPQYRPDQYREPGHQYRPDPYREPERPPRPSPAPDQYGWDPAAETRQIPRPTAPPAGRPAPHPDGPTQYLPDSARPGDNSTRQYQAASAAIPGDAGATPVLGAGGAPKVTVTRAVASRSKQAAQTVTRKVVEASQADGAKESGLTPLIWNQVLSFGADAMITVALAGTVFFGASQGAQKTNVLSYLLVTMAPFAVVAPIIGPALDRLQHGRRWAMAGASFGRALLAVLMAQNFDNLLVLFPLALGSLVLSKAYSVVRAAAAPRVVPENMTLVSANSRLSLFGLGAAVLGGGFIAIVIKITHSYSIGLWITAIAFAVTGYFALRLPKQVDSANASTQHPEEAPRPARQNKVPSTGRIVDWVSRGFDPHVIVAMQGASILRWGQGFLTLFLAFYIQHTSHGFDGAAALGGVGLGVGAGNFLGTAAGARLKLARPELLVMICVLATTAGCIVAAFAFSLTTSIFCMTINSAANSLGKLSLDAVVQKDVSETLRSSAFARSETFLQLAWVFGAAVALLLPVDKGRLGLTVASVFLGVTSILLVLRTRTVGRSTQPGQYPAPGTV
ncbi:MAG: putative arabinose efflux permease, family [Pseudonocardiales bacterium]|nr:putative arabinose efflux permease, family [Pseudonocardiales bacterium]